MGKKLSEGRAAGNRSAFAQALFAATSLALPEPRLARSDGIWKTFNLRPHRGR